MEFQLLLSEIFFLTSKNHRGREKTKRMDGATERERKRETQKKRDSKKDKKREFIK